MKERKLYSSAGALTEQALSAIQTVVAFGAEQVEINRQVHCKILNNWQTCGISTYSIGYN